MESASKFLTKLDFLGVQIKPTLHGKSKVGSVFGGLISLVVAISISFGFGYFGVEMFTKSKPLMNNTQERTEEAKIPWKENPFMLAVYDKFSRNIVDNKDFKRAFEITAEYGILTTTEEAFTVDYYYAPTKKCNESDLGTSFRQNLELLAYDYKTALCLDENNVVNNKGNKYNEQLFLNNRYVYKNSSFVRFRIRLCDEQADPGCRDYALKQGYLNVVSYGSNYYEEQSNYHSPVKPELQAISSFISAEYHQVKYIYSKINHLITDSSLFLSDTTTETYYNIASIENSLAGFDTKDRTIYQLIFSMDQIVNKNQRSYLKIPELLANMGGFMKGMMVLAQILVYTYSEFVFYKEIGLLLNAKDTKPIQVVTRFNQRNSSKIDTSKTASIPKTDIIDLPEVSFWHYLKKSLKFWSSERTKKERFKFLEMEFIVKALSFVDNEMKQKIRTE